MLLLFTRLEGRPVFLPGSKRTVLYSKKILGMLRVESSMFTTVYPSKLIQLTRGAKLPFVTEKDGLAPSLSSAL